MHSKALNHPDHPHQGLPTIPLATRQKLWINSGCTPTRHLSCVIVCFHPCILGLSLDLLRSHPCPHPHPAAPALSSAADALHGPVPLCLRAVGPFTSSLLCPNPVGLFSGQWRFWDLPLLPAHPTHYEGAPSQARPEECLKVSDGLSRKLYSPCRRKHPQILQVLQR